jgi:hypothetical protein
MDCSCIKRTSVVVGDWRLPPCGTVATREWSHELHRVSTLRASVNYREAWVMLALYLIGIVAVQIFAGLSDNEDKLAGLVLSLFWPLLAMALLAASPFLIACAVRKLAK